MEWFKIRGGGKQSDLEVKYTDICALRPSDIKNIKYKVCTVGDVNDKIVLSDMQTDFIVLFAMKYPQVLVLR